MAAALTAPTLLALAYVLARTPFGLSETVAVLVDVDQKPLAAMLGGDGVYFRPLYWGVLSLVWEFTGAVDHALLTYRVLHVATLVGVAGLFLAVCRPRSGVDAAAFAVAFAVLVGPGGFRDNLENLPLNQTLIVVALALGAVRLVLHGRGTSTWLPVALTAAALGVKEQGLAVPAILLAGFLTGSRSVSRRGAAGVALLAGGYLAMRLLWSADWPVFMRSAGLGFRELEPAELLARFGDTPVVVYAYNIAATALNVVAGEPSRGVFHVLRDTLRGTAEVWQWNQLAGTLLTSALIVVWVVSAGRRADDAGVESRVVAATFLAALGISAALGYNYTRDRFNGVPVALYALCAFHAVRWLMGRVATAGLSSQRALALSMVAVLAVLSISWHARAAGTIQYQRRAAWLARKEWIVNYARRQQDERYAHSAYRRMMADLYPQGVDRNLPSTEHDPRWVSRLLEGPW